jgi:hypothetical protein
MAQILRLNTSILSRLFPYKLTLLGRAVFLISLELLINAALWVVAGILFAGKDALGGGGSGDEERDDADRKGLLSLAVLAWVSDMTLRV